MATFQIFDRANQYRIQIIGRFAGLSVKDVEASWKSALQTNLQRQVVVDISRVESCDASGRELLREMQLHGTLIAASNSLSLALLDEITSVRRGTAALQELPLETETPAAKRKRRSVSMPSQAAASGT